MIVPSQEHRFAGYCLRPATEADRPALERWIAADDDHRGKVEAEFFYQGGAGRECWVLEDATGGVVFFFTVERAVRLHIQFPPAMEMRGRERTGEAMLQTFAWMREMGGRCGFRELIFDSTVRPLVRFCERRLGFRKAPHGLSCALPSAPAAGQREAN